MTFKTFLYATAISALSAGTLQAATFTFSAADLVGGSENAALTEVTADSGGLGLTATASTGGAIRQYTQGSPNGLYIGSITSGAFNTVANLTAPASGTYTLAFDQAISSISFDFDYLSSGSGQNEELSGFATDLGPIALTAMDFVSSFATSFDVPSQTVTTTNGRGAGTISYSGATFSSFSFDHIQDPARIGFIIDSITVETVAPVPLPAALPLLLAGLGAIGMARRGRRDHS